MTPGSDITTDKYNFENTSGTMKTGNVSEKSPSERQLSTMQLQALAPEPPSPKSASSTLRECDYDAAITPLYRCIEAKEWDSVLKIANEFPEQAATWVSRKETSGKLRWRLLPLHAAIVYRSPEKVIEYLLASYPLGAQSKDDQGMLPIHLAFRNGASEGVVNLLLVAYPQSIHVKDRKGRIPLILAQASSSPNKDSFLRALERGPSYYAVAAAATERAAVTAEQKAIFDMKVLQMEKDNEEKASLLKIEEEMKCKAYEEKISGLEKELESARNMSNVLSDHISALEAQLESRGDAELLLANKCKKLEEMARNLQKDRDTLDVELNVEKRFNKELEEKVTKLDEQITNNVKMYEDKTLSYSNLEKDLQMEKENLMKENEQLKLDLVSAEDTISGLESRLKKRAAVEESLSSQLSEMARQTAEIAASKCVSETEREAAQKDYEAKIASLEAKVSSLKNQIQDASTGLSHMAQEQDQVCLLAQNYEEKMTISETQQEMIMSKIEAQSEQLELVREQRMTIIEVLSKQMEQLELLQTNQKLVVDELENQKKDLSSVEYLRNMMLDCAMKQKQGLVDKVVEMRNNLELMPEKIERAEEKGEETESIIDGDDEIRDDIPPSPEQVSKIDVTKNQGKSYLITTDNGKVLVPNVSDNKDEREEQVKLVAAAE